MDVRVVGKKISSCAELKTFIFLFYFVFFHLVTICFSKCELVCLSARREVMGYPPFVDTDSIITHKFSNDNPPQPPAMKRLT